MNNSMSNIYKRKSIRLKDYDYSQVGLYYVTICCYNKQHLFGNIDNNEISLNNCGEVARKCWIDIPQHYPNVILHEYVIMPNHIHGIIELLDDDVGANKHSPNKTNYCGDYQSNTNSGCDAVGTNQHSTDTKNVSDCDNKWAKDVSPLPRSPSKTIGSIIRGFKIGVTKWIRQNTNIHDVWQRNYYEHIIRDQHSYEQVTQYIIDNPANWEMDY